MPDRVPACWPPSAVAGAISRRASARADAAAGAWVPALSVSAFAAAASAPAVPAVPAASTVGCGRGPDISRQRATWLRTSAVASVIDSCRASSLPGMRSTAPSRSRLTLPPMNACGLVRTSASIIWLTEMPSSRAMPCTIPLRVSPAWIGPYSPGTDAVATAGGGAGAAAGVAAGSTGGGSAASATGGAAGSGSASTAGSGAGGSGAAATGAGADAGRMMRSPVSTTGAWIGGCAGAAMVSGASISAEYSRTSRPCPQSASIRKVSSGSSTGAVLVTRITGRPDASRATLNCRSWTSPCGGCRPIRAKVSGEARRACSWRSSDGSLETIGISASSGSPYCERTWIWPRPRANAGPASSASARTHANLHLNSMPIPRFAPRL